MSQNSGQSNEEEERCLLPSQKRQEGHVSSGENYTSLKKKSGNVQKMETMWSCADGCPRVPDGGRFSEAEWR